MTAQARKELKEEMSEQGNQSDAVDNESPPEGPIQGFLRKRLLWRMPLAKTFKWPITEGIR